MKHTRIRSYQEVLQNLPRKNLNQGEMSSCCNSLWETEDQGNRLHSTNLF